MATTRCFGGMYGWALGPGLWRLVLAPIPHFDINRSVASYWSANHEWDWTQLQHLLPDSILNVLAAKYILDDPEQVDCLSWNNESSGAFSVSSAYGLATNQQGSIEAAKWNAIWKLKTRPGNYRHDPLTRHETGHENNGLVFSLNMSRVVNGLTR